MRTLAPGRLSAALLWTLRKVKEDAAHVGLDGALRLALLSKYNRLRQWLGLSPCQRLLHLRLHRHALGVYMRPGTSDYRVLSQVFFEREYGALDDLESVKLVIDCGANAGYTSLYFLDRYPQARVIAVEPDPRNVALCRRNLAPYGQRVLVIPSAVWSHAADLRLVRGAYRDGGEWATQVRAVSESETPDVRGVDMPTLIALGGDRPVDILKIDIERSELELFRNGAQRWLPSIRNIAIELHDEECEKAFFAALEPYRADLSRSGELTICRDILARPAERP
jgi:FkbM family methyltransferase